MSGMEQLATKDSKGSQKWIRRAVEEAWPSLEGPILRHIVTTGPVQWLSPVRSEGFAEYRDSGFLDRVGLSNLAQVMAEHWPRSGPVWDALGRTSAGDVLLVEAKAHIAEMCSSPTAASPGSRAIIEKTLGRVAAELGSKRSGAHWSEFFYQLANRLAYLSILRENNVRAWLVLVNFLNDREMNGPTTSEAWEAAYEVAFHVLGLPRRHKLSEFIVHVYPDTAQVDNGSSPVV